MEYELIRNKPAAQFFYKGTHSHPVRRTVLITEQNDEWFKGYEVREGTEVRDVDDAPVKSFSLDKIATTKQLRGSKVKNGTTTLKRLSMSEVDKVGF